MRLALGQDVFARDGQKGGKVDRVVLDDQSHRVDQIVVHKGVLFSTDKLVDRTMIERVDEDGVHLSIDAAEEHKLPDFYQGQYYEWAPSGTFGAPMLYPGWYAGSLLYPNPPAAGRGYPGSDGFFELAPIYPPRVRPEGNVSENDVWIGKGAEVVSADDHKIGHVHDLRYDDTGVLTGFIVRSGLLQRHDREIPAAWVAEVDDDRIRLKVSAAEVERTGAAEAARESGRSVRGGYGRR